MLCDGSAIPSPMQLRPAFVDSRTRIRKRESSSVRRDATGKLSTCPCRTRSFRLFGICKCGLATHHHNEPVVVALGQCVLPPAPSMRAATITESLLR
jgi:hypothetical protein